MRLASDATGVPSPPTLTPASRPRQSPVKPESRIAAGTLLMHWLAAAAHSSVLRASSDSSSARTAGMRPRFPEKMKKQQNVSSRL